MEVKTTLHIIAPDVSGRIVFMHGNLSLTIHKRFDPENYFTFVGYGDYKFGKWKVCT